MKRIYHPIENYGLIGDLNTAALVGLHGSIDFMCFPDFDSPTIFASLLDKDKGGFFEIIPADKNVHFKQMYLPQTNVLLTRFLSDVGIGEITDFMPIANTPTLIRRVKNITGHIPCKMRFAPRFNYARSTHSIVIQGHTAIITSDNKEDPVLTLQTNVPLEIDGQDVIADFTLEHNQSIDFLMGISNSDKKTNLVTFVDDALLSTINYWHQWISECEYKGRWLETIQRSALVLKLLTSKKHGSIVAAPTFSLPEKIGDAKNWDYRYNWIRDTSFTLYAFIRLGYTKEAGDFMDWLSTKCQDLDKPGELGIMYSLDGRKDLTESTLNHLSGYKDSKPVRIGNAAHSQLQLDIYGELMDAVYLYNKFGEMISHDFWNSLKGQIDWLADHWNQKDEGIWEVRGGRQEFLYSRLMCWVAFDRTIRLAEKRSFPINPRWIVERNTIYDTIFKDFWNEERQTFVQTKGSSAVDASTLLMPLVRFISPHDKHWLSTLKAIEKDLVSDSLVYRYKIEEDKEALHEGEGTFSLCTFWYVECLSRSGQIEKAEMAFEKMLGYANHLGLYAEELSYKGEHLGNFPQGFTHLGLISAAYDLNKRISKQA